MKRTILFLMMLFLAFTAVGQLAPTNKPPRVLVAWDANPELDIAGYKIYDGTNSRSYTRVVTLHNTLTNGIVSVSVTNCIITNFVRGLVYYFAATAFNTSGLESDFSEEASLLIPSIPSSPNGVEATNELAIVISAKLEEADDPAGPWNMAVIDPTFHVDSPLERTKFYRMALGIGLIGEPIP
jgi:hypothetical protein